MAETKGIKNVVEVLAAVKALATGGKKVFADGKISISDLPIALDLLRQLSTLNAAIQDVSEVIPEVKDLSAEEAEIVIAKVLEIVNIVRAA